jgi:hypothetical protein
MVWSSSSYEAIKEVVRYHVSKKDAQRHIKKCIKGKEDALALFHDCQKLGRTDLQESCVKVQTSYTETIEIWSNLCLHYQEREQHWFATARELREKEVTFTTNLFLGKVPDKHSCWWHM